jgi:hypothetical protein
MRCFLMVAFLLIDPACASRSPFHEGPTGMNAREQKALLSAGGSRPRGFERFWLRRGCRIGLIKWSEHQSQSVKEAPAGLLNVIRDEIGRVNRGAGDDETVFVSVTVFRWERGFFGRAPRVGYEVIGRDRAGQVMWLGLDRVVVPRERALNLAETDELLLAREVGRKLRAELRR